MYAIIYWETDAKVFAIENLNGTIRLFETLAEANSFASAYEKEVGFDCRVISIDSIHE